MIKVSEKIYEGGVVQLDDHAFFKFHFKDCPLEYAGTGPVSLDGCKFSNIRWALTGPAERTLAFLHGMYHGAGAGGRELVEATFNSIREA